MTGKHPQDSRFGGALTWAAVASLPGLAFVVLCVWRNPWFVDAPFSLWFWVCGLPAVAGGFGGLLRPMRRRVVWWVVLALGGMAVYGLSFRLADGRVSSLDVLVLGVDGVSWDELGCVGIS